MPSENYSDYFLALSSSFDNRLLSQDTAIDKFSLFLEVLMILLFVLSIIRAVIKNRKRTSFFSDIDLENVQSVLRDVAEQRKRRNFPDEHDSAVCNPTTAEDKPGRGLGGGDDGVQLPSIVV